MPKSPEYDTGVCSSCLGIQYQTPLGDIILMQQSQICTLKMERDALRQALHDYESMSELLARPTVSKKRRIGHESIDRKG